MDDIIDKETAQKLYDYFIEVSKGLSQAFRPHSDNNYGVAAQMIMRCFIDPQKASQIVNDEYVAAEQRCKYEKEA